MGKIMFFVSYFLYVILRSKKSFHMLQQNFYNNSNRYVKWIFNNSRKSVLTYDWLFLVIVIIGLFGIDIGWLMFIFYSIMSIYYYDYLKFEQVKIGLKFTKRIGRMCITLLVLYVILTILFKDCNYVYFLFGVLASLNSFVIYLVNVINKPVEKFVYLHYFNMAKNKLRYMDRMSVIGVTGSYGKTSSKNILADIMKVKFDVMPTPQNYNTPYGLMLTINNKMDKFLEYFIAEMGACEVGQIKELCDFVHPKYGILTRIGVAHLDSFKTEENIIKTKFELIESLPHDGIGVLNADDPKQVGYSIKNDCRIVWVGIDNDCDYRAFDIKYTYKGMSFKVKIDGTDYEFSSSLIGRANIYNILAGIALSYELGMSISDIQRGVRSIKPIEHRLQMKKMGKMNIIDDAYNSNPVGSSMAVEALSLMPGEKVIVTPGMIELKNKEYDYNYQFGVEISKVCDKVILVGPKQTKPIQDALKDNNYDESNLYVIDDVKEAFNIVGRDCSDNVYVLLENDLPDIFNE